MTGEAGVIPDAWQACGFSRVTVGSRGDTSKPEDVHVQRLQMQQPRDMGVRENLSAKTEQPGLSQDSCTMMQPKTG